MLASCGPGMITGVASDVRKRLWAPGAVLGAIATVLWIVPWPCPVRGFLHVPCPSCGLTRAARAAAHLDFAEATRVHPLWWLVLPALGAWLVVELGTYVRTGHAAGLDKRRSVHVAFTVIVVALVCVWIARFFGAFGGPVAL